MRLTPIGRAKVAGWLLVENGLCTTQESRLVRPGFVGAKDCTEYR
jgi:hypothetical protein